MADEYGFEEEERPEGSSDDASGGEEKPPDMERELEEKEVKVVGVYENVEQGAGPAVVLLRDSHQRSVLIVIGMFEAKAISLALEGQSADRPLPYDLMHNVIAKLGGTVDRILIDDLWNQTYYAKISLTFDGKALEIDSRPSDAIALGLRARAPIYMAESVLERAAVQEE